MYSIQDIDSEEKLMVDFTRENYTWFDNNGRREVNE